MRSESETRNHGSCSRDRKSSGGRWRPTVGALLLFFALGLLASGALSADPPAAERKKTTAAAAGQDAGESRETPLPSQQEGAAGVGQTRTAMEEWVKTRRIISQERRDWALGREMLNERVQLVQREIDSLRTKISEAQESVTEADKKRADLLEENEKFKQASATLNSAAVALETRTKELLKRLPDPIRERVKPLSQRFPEDPEDTKMSLGERFQNVVGILNEVNKFNREITVTSEVRTLPDGTSAEVVTLYVGIGQAYYASANGKVAGTGTASEEGWVWTPANEAAPAIAQAIAILKNEQAASFVRLPIRVE